MSTNNNKLILYAGGAALICLATIAGVFYIKKKLYKPILTKDQVIIISKNLRKKMMFEIQRTILQYHAVKKHLPPQIFESAKRNPQQISRSCKINLIFVSKFGANQLTYQKDLDYYSNDPEIKKIISIFKNDFQYASVGKNNLQLIGELPNIPYDKLANIYCKITQFQHLRQVKIAKEQILQSYPNRHAFVIRTLSNIHRYHTQKTEKILQQNGIYSEDDSSILIYLLLIQNGRKNEEFAAKLQNIQETYSAIMKKYIDLLKQNQTSEIINQLQKQLINII